MTETRLALVLGATGGIGGAMVQALQGRGYRVRAMRRGGGPADRRPGLEWVAGDALATADVVRAAEGAAVIVHAVNPPAYRNWGRLVLPMIDSTIAAARASGARVVLPGTIYNFGPDAFPLLAETSPQHPVTMRGRIRAEMERRLQAAVADGVRTLVVRAGDFFGPQAGNNWFSQVMVAPGKPVTRILVPNRRGVGHQWGYLPDVAETMVRLLDRESDLAPFEAVHMAGHWDPDGTAMVEAIRRAAGGRPGVWRFPWWALVLAAPFNETMRGLWAMRYLWQQPLRMDNARLRSLLGEEPHTPLDVAVRAGLEGLGCLGTPPVR